MAVNSDIHCSSCSFKPRPKDNNVSTQNIPTMLAQHLQAPAKRSQHFNATDCNIVGATCCVRLATLLQRVATCCELKIELVRMPGRKIVSQTWSNEYNIMQHSQMLHEKFDNFQISPTTPNMSRQGGQTQATRCTQQCCDRLAGALDVREMLSVLEIATFCML